MDMDVDLGCHAPTWVRIPSFPLDFGNNEVFMDIANFFDSLLSIDKVTQTKYPLFLANIFLSMAVNKALLTEVTIDSKLGSYIQVL